MFEALPLPTPFDVGPVNAYLAGRTLVDPGPDSGAAWDALRDGLDTRGLSPADVEQVLLTHPHPDHVGAAGRLRDRGATILAGKKCAPIVADFGARLAYQQTYFAPLFERWGLAPEEVDATLQLPSVFLPYVEDVTVDRPLAAGDTVTVDGRTLRVDTLAGHARGEVLFAEEDTDRVAVVGDHVLAETTPNPLLQPPEDPEADRPHVLARFNDSLARLREQGYDRLLPGHGDPIQQPAARIDAMLAAHETRTEAVLELLDEPRTPASILHELFGDLPATEVFGGMSEAVGHLDLLVERGAAAVREDGDVLVYERVD